MDSESVCLVCKDGAFGDVNFEITRLIAGRVKARHLFDEFKKRMAFGSLACVAFTDILTFFCIYSLLFAPILCRCVLMDLLTIFSFFQLHLSG